MQYDCQLLNLRLTYDAHHTAQATAYATQDDVQAFLLANSDYAIAAVFFVFSNASDLNSLTGFLLQTNTTVKYFKGTYQNPNFFVQLPLQSAVQREIARYLMLQVRDQGGFTGGLLFFIVQC